MAPRTSSAIARREQRDGLAVGWLAGKRSRSTRRAYRGDLVDVGRWILAHCAPARLPQADRATDRDAIAAVAIARIDWLAAWRDQAAGRLAPATIARRLAALRTFYEYLAAGGIRRDNPGKHVEAPIVAAEEQRRPHLEDHQVRALLAAAAQTTCDPRRADRNAALILLLASAGLRISEALGLTPADVDIDRRIVRIRSATAKRGKPRALEVSQRLARHLRALVQDLDAGARLIPITRERARQLLIRWATRAGLPEHLVTPHALRRTFGTIATDRGIPLEALRRAMGHEDPRTTARYDRRRQASAIVEYD